MCQGVNESYLLPLFLSNLSTTEICLMLLIEKQGPDISYRSRNCNKDNIPLCDVCKSTFDTLTHFHHNFLNQSCSEFENLNTKHKNVTFDETFVEAHDETKSNLFNKLFDYLVKYSINLINYLLNNTNLRKYYSLVKKVLP